MIENLEKFSDENNLVFTPLGGTDSLGCIPNLVPFIREQISLAVQGKENVIREIISKYSNAEETIVNGRNYLVVEGEQIPFGYPYPSSREKYIVRDILKLLTDN